MTASWDVRTWPKRTKARRAARFPYKVGAFCQECGSALNLKLCKQCEAINESKAQRCHHCEAPLPAQPAVEPAKKSEAAPRASAASRLPRSLAVVAAALIAVLAGLAYSIVYRQPAAIPVAATPEPPATEGRVQAVPAAEANAGRRALAAPGHQHPIG